MNNIKKSILFTILLAFSTSATVKPFTKEDAYVALGCVAAATLAGWLIYYFTPSALEKATRTLSKVESDDLLKKQFNSEAEFEDFVNANFSSSWPLVDVKNRLFDLKNDITYAQEQIGRAERKDIANGPVCRELSEKAQRLSDKITKSISTIRNKSDYKAQVSLYEEQQRMDKKLSHEEHLLDRKLWNKHFRSYEKDRLLKKVLKHKEQPIKVVTPVVVCEKKTEPAPVAVCEPKQNHTSVSFAESENR